MAKYGDAKEQAKGQPKKRRKTSAFLVFSNEMREEVKKKLEASSSTADHAKELGAMWKSLEAKEKERWQAKAEAIDAAKAPDAAEAASPVAERDEEDDE